MTAAGSRDGAIPSRDRGRGRLATTFRLDWGAFAPVATNRLPEPMSITEAAVTEALKTVIDPNTERDLIGSRAARNIRVDGSDVAVDIELGYPAASQIGLIRDQVEAALRTLPGLGRTSLNVYQKIQAHQAQRGVNLLPNVKNIIAVASGKGGVGKSTTAANLALALAAEGASVGMLDADIYGPSQPMMLGITGRPTSTDGKTMEPMEGHGLQASSIGFLVDTDTPMIWRGPMATSALTQLFADTRWGDLDYLLVDLPPGTGDIQLTLAQKIPVAGAVIVTTPQEIATLDARKALKMFEQVNVPVLGIVENMAVHVCSNCGHAEHLFGQGGGEAMAAQYGVPLLGSLPLDLRIREQGDAGTPVVAAAPNSAPAQAYLAAAQAMAAQLATRPRASIPISSALL